ncbi:hypothetical protein RQP46_005328 [Phenoliferia psychrophenolica]
MPTGLRRRPQDEDVHREAEEESCQVDDVQLRHPHECHQLAHDDGGDDHRAGHHLGSDRVVQSCHHDQFFCCLSDSGVVPCFPVVRLTVCVHFVSGGVEFLRLSVEPDCFRFFIGWRNDVCVARGVQQLGFCLQLAGKLLGIGF